MAHSTVAKAASTPMGMMRFQGCQNNNTVLIDCDRKCDLGDVNNRPPSVEQCGPQHNGQICSTGDCCSSDGRCVRTDRHPWDLVHANVSRGEPRSSARTVSQLLESAHCPVQLRTLRNLRLHNLLNNAVGLRPAIRAVPFLNAVPLQAFASVHACL